MTRSPSNVEQLLIALFDQIPVCMLFDARVTILPPMALLFSEIYRTCKIPDQWKVAKINNFQPFIVFYNLLNIFFEHM